MYEKRVHVRVPVGLEGSYQPITRLAAPRLGITRDISLGGACFASFERIEAGAKIALSLSLPAEGPVTLTGLVVWSRVVQEGPGQSGYQAGLCWENVDTHAQDRLNSFLTGYTRSDIPVIITSGPARPQFSWFRVLSLTGAVAVLLWITVSLWLQDYTLASENVTLQKAVQAYQHLIEHVVHLSR